MTSATPPSEADVAEPTEPPAASEEAAAAQPTASPQAQESAASTAGPAEPPASQPRGKRWLRVLRVTGVVIALPIVAFAIGLLIAWIVHAIRGDRIPTATAGTAAASVPPIAPASTPAKRVPARVTVPADWVTEVAPPVGLSYRHPAGWIRRTAAPEVLRIAPAAPGSTAPGVDAVGAGIETDSSPAAAARSFATRNYGDQPQFDLTPPVAVAGHHPGEQQVVASYRRAGVEVRVVIHSYRSGTSTVVALGRAAVAQPTRAGQLEAFIEASLTVSS